MTLATKLNVAGTSTPPSGGRVVVVGTPDAVGGAVADAAADGAGDAAAVPTTPPESRAEGETVVGAAGGDPALTGEGDPAAGAAVVAPIPPPDGRGEVGSSAAAVGGGDGVGVGPSVG
jgi:hypothetical protein